MEFSGVSLTGLEDLNILILLELPYQDLLRVRLVDTYFNRLLQKEDFWKLKIEKDFGLEILNCKPEGESYHDQYMYIIYNTKNLDQAVSYGDLDVLIVLKNLGVLPTEKEANQAAKMGYLEILKWMANYNIFPDSFGADLAARYGHLEVLKWMDSQGIYPPAQGLGAIWAARNGFLDILKWLANYNIYPDITGANLAAEFVRIEVLNWLADHDIYPNKNINFLIKNNCIDYLRRLAQNRAIHLDI